MEILVKQILEASFSIDKKLEHGKLSTLKEFEICLTNAFRTMNNGQ